MQKVVPSLKKDFLSCLPLKKRYRGSSMSLTDNTDGTPTSIYASSRCNASAEYRYLYNMPLSPPNSDSDPDDLCFFEREEKNRRKLDNKSAFSVRRVVIIALCSLFLLYVHILNTLSNTKHIYLYISYYNLKISK